MAVFVSHAISNIVHFETVDAIQTNKRSASSACSGILVHPRLRSLVLCEAPCLILLEIAQTI